jgi:serine/threonine protein kinase
VYLAPEQALGEHLDARSDIFSLGVVLYQSCTGEHPFTGKTIAALFDALLHTEPIPVRERNPKVGGALAAIIERALQRQPQHRQQTAEELEQQLLEMRPPRGRTWRGAGGLKWAAIASAVALAGAGGLYVGRFPKAATVTVAVSQATDSSEKNCSPAWRLTGKRSSSPPGSREIGIFTASASAGGMR